MKKERQLVLIEMGGGLKHLCWIDQGKDGSFYFGLGNPNSEMEVSMPIKSADKKILYKDFKNFKKNSSHKVSFHPSSKYFKTGTVHFRVEDTMGNKVPKYKIAEWDLLKNEIKPRQLAIFCFPEPKKLPVFTGSFNRQKDITIPLNDLTNINLAGAIISLPKSILMEELINLVEKRMGLSKNYACAKFKGGLFDILILLHEVGGDGPWPSNFVLGIPNEEVFF